MSSPRVLRMVVTKLAAINLSAKACTVWRSEHVDPGLREGIEWDQIEFAVQSVAFVSCSKLTNSVACSG